MDLKIYDFSRTFVQQYERSFGFHPYIDDLQARLEFWIDLLYILDGLLFRLVNALVFTLTILQILKIDKFFYMQSF